MGKTTEIRGLTRLHHDPRLSSGHDRMGNVMRKPDARNPYARFQVVEVRHGYAVKDTRDGSIWTQTYVRLGWAVRKAVSLNESFKNHRYS